MSLVRRMLACAGIAALVAAVAALPAGARGDHGRSRAAVPQPISAADFLTMAAASNRFEIVTGQLAQDRSASDAIRSLGAEFVAHHTAMLQQGAAVASKLGIAVPGTLTREQQRTVQKLQHLTGKRFDRAWLRAQLRAHRKALFLHLRGAIRGEAPEIRTLAQAGLPVITHHYGQLLDLATGDDGHGDHGHANR